MYVIAWHHPPELYTSNPRVPIHTSSRARRNIQSLAASAVRYGPVENLRSLLFNYRSPECLVQWKTFLWYMRMIFNTLFSECLAHENHPNFLKSLSHRPRPRVSNPGSPLELGEINVHFFWRRVYEKWKNNKTKDKVAKKRPQFIFQIFLFPFWDWHILAP